jgi:hypothetical protein
VDVYAEVKMPVVDELQPVIAALVGLRTASEQALEHATREGTNGSLENTDRGIAADNPARQSLIAAMVTRASLAIVVSTDGLLATTRLITPPWYSPLASAAVVRQVIEAAGIVCWLLDPHVDLTRRLKRGLGLLKDENLRAGSFVRSRHPQVPHLRERLQASAAHVDLVSGNYERLAEQVALQPAPFDPAKIAAAVDASMMYEVLSGAVHGRTASVEEFQVMMRDDQSRGILWFTLVHEVAAAYSKGVLRFVTYRQPRLAGDLRAAFDDRLTEMNITASERRKMLAV